MSLILDALNRSREDQGGVPGLGSQHALEPAARRSPLLPVLAIALTLALAVIAWLLLRGEPAPDPVGARSASEAVRPQGGLPQDKPAASVGARSASEAVRPQSGLPQEKPAASVGARSAGESSSRPVRPESGLLQM